MAAARAEIETFFTSYTAYSHHERNSNLWHRFAQQIRISCTVHYASADYSVVLQVFMQSVKSLIDSLTRIMSSRSYGRVWLTCKHMITSRIRKERIITIGSCINRNYNLFSADNAHSYHERHSVKLEPTAPICLANQNLPYIFITPAPITSSCCKVHRIV